MELNVKVQLMDEKLQDGVKKAIIAVHQGKIQTFVAEEAEMIARIAKWKVATQAKTYTGKLERAIETEGLIYNSGTIAVGLGWEAIPVRRRKSSRQYRDRRYKSEQYRPVATVDDYARILEFSPTRQLRHLYETFEEEKDGAALAIENKLNQFFGEIFK